MNTKDYQNYPLYSQFLSEKSRIITTSSSSSLFDVTFSNYFYKSSSTVGTCNEWENFFKYNISLPFDDLTFSAATVSFAYSDLSQTSVNKLSAKCSDNNIVSNIVNSLNSNLHYSAFCNGNIWRVAFCKTYSAFCVNCDKVCDTCPSNSFLISPCVSNCNLRDRNSYGILHLETSKKDLFPFLSQPITTKYFETNSSLLLSISLSKPGLIYCQSFESSIILTDIFEVIRGGIFESVLPERVNNTILIIPNIYVGINYNIYCYTQDFSNHAMVLSNVLATKTEFKTPKCCRKIIINVGSNPYFTTAHTSTIQVILDTTPLSNILVSLVLTSCDNPNEGGGNNLPLLSPSSFIFDKNTPNLYRNFIVVTSNSAGCFYINANMTSKGITDIPYTGDQVKIQILPADTPPTAPSLTSILFSDDGRQLVGVFDSPTNMGEFGIGKIFFCSAFLRFALSTKTSCYWNSSTILLINIYETLSVNVGDTILFLGRPIKGECIANSRYNCADLLFSNQVNAKVDPPNNPIRPQIILNTAAEIGECSPILIDPLMSYGHGNKPWKSIEWNVECVAVSQQSPNITNILNYLNQNGSTIDKIIEVPNYLLWKSYPKFLECSLISFSLKLENVFLKSNVATTTVKINRNKELPTALVNAPIKAYRNQEFAIYGSGMLSACPDAINTNDLRYVWNVYQEYNFEPTIVTTSKDPSLFLLPPFTLQSNKAYTIQLMVSMVSRKVLISTTTSKVVVFSADIVPVISGGPERLVSSLVKFFILYKKKYVFLLLFLLSFLFYFRNYYYDYFNLGNKSNRRKS